MRISHQHLVSSGLCVLLLATCCSETWAGTKGQKKDRAARRAARAEADATTTDTQKTQRANLVTRQDVDAALQGPCPETTFAGEMPLGLLLKQIQEHLAKLGTVVAIVPDRSELWPEGIESLDDVRIPALHITAGTHTCAALLQLILDQTTEPSLAYDIRPGHLLISSRAKLESEDNLFTQVYDVSDLLLEPVDSTSSESTVQPSAPLEQSNERPPAAQIDSTSKADSARAAGAKVLKQFGGPAGGPGGPGMAVHSGGACQPPFDPVGMVDIRSMIQQQTSPPAKWFDIDGEGGQMSVLGQYVVIRQTPGVHDQIESLLAMLREAMVKGGPRQHVPARPVAAQPQGRGAGFFSVSP